ncbi:hypothetical protein BSLA_02r0299 [Burkholderia stabilis]|nr:hypothetical protein BSLA_02r0299 [Burkholderia stabilis]
MQMRRKPRRQTNALPRRRHAARRRRNDRNGKWFAATRRCDNAGGRPASRLHSAKNREKAVRLAPRIRVA